MKPLIGISCGTFHDRAWCPPSYGHRQTYVDAILRAGGAPLLMPPVTDLETLRVLYERVDGVLLAGGGDIAPANYGAEPHEKLGLVDAVRDEAELPVARWAVAEGKPVLGICRGIQVINVAFGGSLYQDIPSQLPDTFDHRANTRVRQWDLLTHSIALEPDSWLAERLSTDEVMGNTMHHQSVKDLAPGMRVVGRAPDGVIEAMEGTGEQFVVAVQCHPEHLWPDAETRWLRVFEGFVAACGR
jgi:putative glutamine amidotransferase